MERLSALFKSSDNCFFNNVFNERYSDAVVFLEIYIEMKVVCKSSIKFIILLLSSIVSWESKDIPPLMDTVSIMVSIDNKIKKYYNRNISYATLVTEGGLGYATKTDCK